MSAIKSRPRILAATIAAWDARRQKRPGAWSGGRPRDIEAGGVRLVRRPAEVVAPNRGWRL